MRDAEPLGEAEGRNAVDDAEIDGLGAAAQVRVFRRTGTPNMAEAVAA